MLNIMFAYIRASNAYSSFKKKTDICLFRIMPYFLHCISHKRKYMKNHEEKRRADSDFYLNRVHVTTCNHSCFLDVHKL